MLSLFLFSEQVIVDSFLAPNFLLGAVGLLVPADEHVDSAPHGFVALFTVVSCACNVYQYDHGNRLATQVREHIDVETEITKLKKYFLRKFEVKRCHT